MVRNHCRAHPAPCVRPRCVCSVLRAHAQFCQFDKSRRAVVSYWRKYVHEVLVNRLGGLSLPRKSVVRLTDRPDMTLDVYRGRKTTKQQSNKASLIRRTPPPTFSNTAITDRHSDTTIFQLRAHWVRISWSIGSEKSFGHVPPVGVEPSTSCVQSEHPIH